MSKLSVREERGIPVGCVPAGKVALSCMAQPPGARASPRGDLWCHRVGAGSHRAGSPSNTTLEGDETIVTA